MAKSALHGAVQCLQGQCSAQTLHTSWHRQNVLGTCHQRYHMVAATSTQPESPSSDPGTNRNLFVHLNSFRHLLTRNVCPTTKSHVVRSARQWTSGFTDNFPFRADFSLAASQEGSGLLLWILSSFIHAGTGKTRKICSLTYLSHLVVAKKSGSQVLKWDGPRGAPEAARCPRAPASSTGRAEELITAGDVATSSKLNLVPWVWQGKSPSSLELFCVLSMEKDKAAEQSSEHPSVLQAVNDHSFISTDTPGWSSSLHVPRVPVLQPGRGIPAARPSGHPGHSTGSSSTKAEAPQDQHCRTCSCHLPTKGTRHCDRPGTGTCWCWLL